MRTSHKSHYAIMNEVEDILYIARERGWVK
jgi:hypothetical protein